MKYKPLVLLFVVMFILGLFPAPAFAAEGNALPHPMYINNPVEDAAGLEITALAVPAAATGIRLTCKTTMGKALPGVAIGIYTDSAAVKLLQSGTSDANGQILFTGLEAKTHYIKVISMPKGYELPEFIIPLAAEADKTLERNIIFEQTDIGTPYDSRQLKSLKVSAGKLSPLFTPEKLNYTLKLDEKTGKVTITPVQSDTASQLYINGKSKKNIALSLKNGASSKVTIRIKPKSGHSRYYKVTVTRAKSKNANIKKLTVSAGKLSPSFKRTATAYTLVLAKSQSSVRLGISLESAYAQCSLYVNGKKTSSRTILLKRGEKKTVRIVVKAQDRSVVKTYTVTIRRAK